MSHKIKITHLKTAALIPYARNSRTHSESQVAQIAASIREFGFTNPILVDGDNGIIAGHGRVLAARALGLNEVPCIIMTHLTEAQKRAYVIADNSLALNSGWDVEMLKVEMNDLRDDDFDVSLIGLDESILGAGEDESRSPGNEESIPETREVIAECASEGEQQMIYNILTGKGFKCRLSTF